MRPVAGIEFPCATVVISLMEKFDWVMKIRAVIRETLIISILRTNVDTRYFLLDADALTIEARMQTTVAEF